MFLTIQCMKQTEMLRNLIVTTSNRLTTLLFGRKYYKSVKYDIFCETNYNKFFFHVFSITIKRLFLILFFLIVFGNTNNPEKQINESSFDTFLKLMDAFVLTVTCRGQILLISNNIEQFLGHSQVCFYYIVMLSLLILISYKYILKGTILYYLTLFIHYQH